MLFVPIISEPTIFILTPRRDVKTPARKKHAHLNCRIWRASVCIFHLGHTRYLMNKWSEEQDRTADRGFTKRMRMLSGPGIMIFVLTVTFASVDWAMSLNPEWFSTIYGLLFVAAWVLSALAFAILIMAIVGRREPLARVVNRSLFTSAICWPCMLWHTSLLAFLIVWSGNSGRDSWYLQRVQGPGRHCGSRRSFTSRFRSLVSLQVLKRNASKLFILAIVILVIRLIDFFWMIAPEFSHGGFHVSWMDIVAPIGLGGVWLAMFFWQLNKRPLVPINDPQYEQLLAAAQAPAHAEY